MSRTGLRATRRTGGFGIVELLVAMAIGLVLTLAISLMLIRHDSDKRTLTSSNDAQLNASYVGYLLDRQLRSAGSGLTQGWRTHFGCLLYASRGGTRLMPRATAFPAPFSAIPQQVRLAPALIHAGAGQNGSDVLMVTMGASGLAEATSRVLPGSVSAGSVRVPATLGMRGDDLVLLSEDGLGCMLQQLQSPFTGGTTQQLNFGGTYAANTIDTFNLTSYGLAGTTQLASLGNISTNPPVFSLIGIGTNQTLFSLDLLRLNGQDVPQPLAEGIVDLRARYGVDTDGDGRVDTWVAPTAAGYTAASLTDGTAAAQQRLLSIMMVRIGLIVRTDRVEKDTVAPASLTLFGDMAAGLSYTRNLTTDERRTRHRTLEVTVPLRNVMHAGRT